MTEQRFHRTADTRRLRWWLALLFFGLAIPAVLLIRQAFEQLELDAFRQQQIIAESLVRRIDSALVTAFRVEDARAFEDFTFTGAAPDEAGGRSRRSPLASLPVASPVPGAVGYFQVDEAGSLTTPLLPAGDIDPAAYGLAGAELRERSAAAADLVDILARNRLVRGRAAGNAGRTSDAELALADEDGIEALRSSETPTAALAGPGLRKVAVDAFETEAVDEQTGADAPSASPADSAEATPGVDGRGQAAFDQLAIRRARSALPGSASPDSASADPASPGVTPPAAQTAAERNEPTAAETSTRQVREERRVASTAAIAARIETFQSELEPLAFSGLDTGHFVLFRNAWRNGERFVQGLLIDGEAFIEQGIAAPFAAAGLAPAVRLTVATGAGRAIEVTAPRPAGREGAARENLLHAARLSPPFADIELRFDAGDLESGAGSGLLTWTAIVLFSVLAGGILAMYRFGVKQIELTRQQQNFVSAVSHELKTPLTSIRMYGEMLKSGWASDEKKQTYYDFIFAEGERLSRLIDNVLTLARLDRSAQKMTLELVTVREIVDLIRSKVSSLAEQAGFSLTFEVEESAGDVSVRVDPDAISQIFINLVDNALKFAAGAAKREVVISGHVQDGSMVFDVRDFGPGIPAADMRRLFELFYRPENELTRATAGTGIGLALVRELMSAMGGRVDVRNRDPGAEFRLLLPVAPPSA